jgi:hypothetical protein
MSPPSSRAKDKILAAIEWVESHFRIADGAVETDAAAIKPTAETRRRAHQDGYRAGADRRREGDLIDYG